MVLSVVVVLGGAVVDGVVTIHPPKGQAPANRRKPNINRTLRLSIFVLLRNSSLTRVRSLFLSFSSWSVFLDV